MAAALSGVSNDLRFALRQLRKQLGLATSAIFTLALGVN